MTIQVTDQIVGGKPVPNVLVALNDADGELVDPNTVATTDSAGRHVFPKVGAGYSVTVAGQSALNRSKLQTVFGLKPGGTYNFVMPANEAPTPVAHITVSFAGNLPDDIESIEVAVGGTGHCFGDSNNKTVPIEIDVTPDCLDSDGRMTVFGSASGSSHLPVNVLAYSLAPSLSLLDPSSQKLNLSVWNNAAHSILVNLRHGPGTIDFPETKQRRTTILGLKRSGKEYLFDLDSFGTASGSDLTGLSYTLPDKLLQVQGGDSLAYLLSFSSQFKKADGSLVQGGFVTQTLSAEPLSNIDMGDKLSNLDLSGVVPDIHDPLHPSIFWNPPSDQSKFSAAVALATWKDSNGSHQWSATAPTGQEQITMPKLPLVMSLSTPQPGAVVQGPVLYLVDVTWCGDNYDCYAVHSKDPFLLRSARFEHVLDGQAGEATLKYAASQPFSFFEPRIARAAAVKKNRLSRPGSDMIKARRFSN